MKPFILFGSSIMIIAILISAVAFINKKNEIPEKHLEVVLRDLGHQLLLTAKDSSSRVMPVKKLNSTTYQISFQNEFDFFWLLLLIIPLSFLGFYMKDKFRKKEETASIVDNNDYVQLGNFKFH